MSCQVWAAAVGFAIIFEVSHAFRWTCPNVMEVAGCTGSQVTLPWSFETNDTDQVLKLYWNQAGHTAASWFKSTLTQGTRFGNRLQTVNGSMAAISIDRLVLDDMGYYTLNVDVQTKEKVSGASQDHLSTASAYLTVGEPPEGGLLAQYERFSDDTCAAQRRVTLSCGPLTKRGVPPVSVEWMDPAGQVLQSSREESGRFFVELPRRALPGNYSCRLAGKQHVLQCIPDQSPLRKASLVFVPREVTSREGCTDPEFGEEEDLSAVEALTQNVTRLQASLERFQNEWETLLEGTLAEMTSKMVARGELESLQNTVKILETNCSTDMDVLKQRNDNNYMSIQYLQQEMNKVSSDVARILGNLTDGHEAQQQGFADVWATVLKLESSIKQALQTRGTTPDDSNEDLQNMKRQMKGLQEKISTLEALFRLDSSQLQLDLCHLENATGVNLLCEMMERLDSLGDNVETLRGGPPSDDPLTKTLRPTWTITSPKNGTQSTQLTTLAVTDDGVFVAGENERCEIVTGQPQRIDEVAVRDLKKFEAAEVRSVSLLPSGKVAVVVQSYIYIGGVQGGDSGRWIFTQKNYFGSAARTDDTLFVGKRADSVDGPRVDIVSLGTESAEVQSIVLTHETTQQLESPDYLSVHENQLYVSDWITHHVIRLDLDSGRVTIWRGPLYNPHNLHFYEPRQAAFDDMGNMYLATGGNVCGYHGGAGHYSKGFCVLMIAKHGGWKVVAEQGRDNYPYGIAVIDKGIAVTWVSWEQLPHMASSYIQGYELVDA